MTKLIANKAKDVPARIYSVAEGLLNEHAERWRTILDRWTALPDGGSGNPDPDADPEDDLELEKQFLTTSAEADEVLMAEVAKLPMEDLPALLYAAIRYGGMEMARTYQE
jgi:hypothetical protein